MNVTVMTAAVPAMATCVSSPGGAGFPAAGVAAGDKASGLGAAKTLMVVVVG